MAIHVIKGEGAPTGFTPPSTGVHYIDVVAKNTYISVGNQSPTDWILTGGSGTSFTNFLALLDTPVSYNAQAGKVPIVNGSENQLIFDNEKLVDLKDVNSDGLADNMVFVYDFADGQTFKPQYRMDWKDNWAVGTYKTNSVVKDQGWVMISNKETTDRAAPQPDGNSSWALSDNPTWQAGQTSPIAIQGLRFTIGSEVVTIDGFRAWRATDTGNESYSYVIQDLTDENNPTLISSGTLPQGPVGWVDIISSGGFFYEGQVIDIKFATEVSTSSSQWTHTWTLQDAVGGLPASGTYTHNADHSLLRISVDADGPVNVKSDLDQLKVGDTLLMFEFLAASRFNDYQVASAPSYSNGDTVLELPVVRVGNGQPVRTGNLSQGDANIKAGSLPANYTSIPNYWFLNPPVGGGTVNGYLINDWNQTPSLNDDAFGIDIRGHGWIASDDWDVITTVVGGGGGSTGGGGTGIDEFRQLVDTPNSYAGQGSKYVSVKNSEDGLEFVDSPTSLVTSVFTRTGDVVAQTGDYSAAQVGADTSAEVDAKDVASIDAHVAQQDPHPQYVLPSDLPSIAITYFTGVTSPLDGTYLVTSVTTLGNVENSVSASTSTIDVPALIGQWLRDPVFDADGTLLATGSKVTLDLDANSDFLDVRVEFGVRRAVGPVFEVLGTNDYMVTQGRSAMTVDVPIPETAYLTGDTSFIRLYLIKKSGAGGGSVTMTLYMEGDYISRSLTDIPGQAFPAPHASSHEVGGSDQVNHDNLLNAQGFKSHSQIDTDLADHESRIAVNEFDIIPLQQNSPPASGKVAGRFLAVANSGIASFTISDTGSYNVDGTFRFTQKSTSLSGQGVFGDAVISGNVLTSITVLRSTGYGYQVSEVVELDIPDAGENVSAKITIDTLGVGQQWQEIVIPPPGVTSFNTRTGDVVSQTGDYNADQIDDAATTKKFATQAQLDQIATNTIDISNNTTAIAGKEDGLGNPAEDGYVLSSTTAGVRSWIPQSGGGGGESFASTPLGGDFSAGSVTGSKVGLDNNRSLITLSIDSGMTLTPATIDWTPSLITTNAWYRSDTGITESGGKVSQWDDLSGNDNHCVEANTTRQPTFIASDPLLNNYPTVGNTTESGLLGLKPLVFWTFEEVYCVVYYKDGIDVTFDVENALLGGTGSSGRPNIGGNPNSANWRTATTLQAANFKNGTTVSSDVALPLPATVYRFPMKQVWNQNIDLLRPTSASNRSWNGAITEILFFESILPEVDRQRVEGYLAWEYGLEGDLDPAHPYKSAAPTIIVDTTTGSGAANIIPSDYRPDSDLTTSVKVKGENIFTTVTFSDTVELTTEEVDGNEIGATGKGKGVNISFIKG